MSRLAMLALAALVLGGCIRAEENPDFHATATRPVVFIGYDYGAVTAQPGNGTFEVTANAQANTGSAAATFTYAGRQWEARFTRFAESRPFHEGGVRALFQEHGATGNGDAALPELRAQSAGWGVGTLTADGQPFPDPATGGSEFAMHYMVTDTAVRDPETYQVTKADGGAPYDPATPADARTFPGTGQVLLNIQSMGPALPMDLATSLTDTVQEPQYSNSATFDVNGTARILVNITVSNPTPLPSVGQLSFVLSDPAGTEVGRFDYDLQTAQPAGAIEVPAANATGAYLLTVSGAGLAVDYRADILVDYPQSLFLHLAYLDVQVG